MKSLLFKIAHNLVKKLGLSMSQALVKSWRAVKLKAKLRTGIVEFSFTKKDGSIRKAIGTLETALFDYEAKGSSKENFSSIAYYDLESKAFRSFTVENLI